MIYQLMKSRRSIRSFTQEIPATELVERLAGRRLCRSCGKGCHVVFDKPRQEGLCDVCGGELYQREDDNVATVGNRLDGYRRQTEPLVDYYRRRDLLECIVGSGMTPDEVFGVIEKTLAGH